MNIFFMKRVVVLRQILSPLQETEHRELEGFFDIEFDFM